MRGADARLDFGAGLWRLADPKISLASFSSILLGGSTAAADGPLRIGWLGITVAGIFALEVAKNASGEIVDYDSGTDLAIAPEDESPFSGGKGVLVDGLLTRRQTWAIAAVAYALGIAAGLGIALWRAPGVLALGLVGVACAYLYHAAPLRLSYRGFGEIAVALCYGPLICSGTYLVQRGAVSWSVVYISIPLGLLVGAFLWVNEFPDYRADRACGKRNLVVRLGRRRASLAFAGIVGAALVGAGLLPLAGLPYTVWLGLAAGIPAALAVGTVLAHPECTARLVPAQGQTLLSFIVYAGGAGLGMLLGR